MNQTVADARAVPDYAKPAEKRGRRAVVCAGALVWGFVTLLIFTQLLDGAETNAVRLRTQVVLLACVGVRLAWAVFRGEKGKAWLFYVVLLLLAAPLWLVIEFKLAPLCHALWRSS
jgi:TRAP-type mannitol/chloroaromatic compound transport system permease large subunit